MLLLHRTSKENREPKGKPLLLFAVGRHQIALRTLHSSKRDIFLHTEYHGARTKLAKSAGAGEFYVTYLLKTPKPALCPHVHLTWGLSESRRKTLQLQHGNAEKTLSSPLPQAERSSAENKVIYVRLSFIFFGETHITQHLEAIS